MYNLSDESVQLRRPNCSTFPARGVQLRWHNQAIDGSMCSEQAEKLGIIRSHMDGLDLCKTNIESVILSLT